ncbi:MAG: hypothetical protein GAK29_04491 [Acinetobacter bereziniae]|uniref:Uncharacterized protein n=1 Tax=Acinetobacter bereziniae TaxID=106648 RepID=A0A833UIY3_ACIBZ|nr:MAG: hypothetical protein GAK29_04491 [Acinetobacter bereziniae]
MKLQYENVYVCIYFDSDVNKNVKWPNQFLTDSWHFTSKSFGFLGDPLYAIFHAGKHPGGEPATYLDELKDNRSVLDSGMLSKNAWEVEDDNARIILLRQVGYIIECK